MDSARIVITRKDVVTLNGDKVGRVQQRKQRDGYDWVFIPLAYSGPFGLSFSRSRLDAIRTELYLRLSIPLSGR